MRSLAVGLVQCAALAAAALPSPDAEGRYTITAPGITAKFIPYAATLTNLFVKDKNGVDTDVVLGYDDANYYPIDPKHPVYNEIPGRYVGRIGHAAYEMSGKTYETEQNNGNNTLHSGRNNWSHRFWNLTAVDNSSITFSIFDKAGDEQGFPGNVEANVTYFLTKDTLNVKMLASSDAETPLMLTQHTYFNLDAYRNPHADKIWNHTLYLPYSHRYLESDSGKLPTGRILTAEPLSINDFASVPDLQIGHGSGSPGFVGNCDAGGSCVGFDGYFLVENAPENAPVVRLASAYSGIWGELRTNQPGVTLYTCDSMDGTGRLKSTQGTANVTTVAKNSCIAIEAHDYPDGINHPEWNRKAMEISEPGKLYHWQSSWTFGTF